MVVQLVSLNHLLLFRDGWLVDQRCLVKEFEASFNHHQTPVDTLHHEERPSVQKAFLRDVKALEASFDEYGNPFLESSGDLLVLNTRDVADKAVIDTLYKIEERLVERVKPLNDAIPRNMLPLFSTAKKRQKTKAQQMMAELKGD